jgi:hypothetical protein
MYAVSIVGIIIRLRLTRLGNRGSKPNRHKKFENAQKGPAALPHSCLMDTVYINGRGVKLTSPLQVVLRLMHSNLHPLFRMPS